VTDDATIIKYFTNPYVQGIFDKKENGVKLLRKRVLWGKEKKPTARELLVYLNNPDTMDYYMECIEPEWKSIPSFQEYKQIVYKDLVFKVDPMKHLAEKYHM
jgi:hypothetical protein